LRWLSQDSFNSAYFFLLFVVNPDVISLVLVIICSIAQQLEAKRTKNDVTASAETSTSSSISVQRRNVEVYKIAVNLARQNLLEIVATAEELINQTNQASQPSKLSTGQRRAYLQEGLEMQLRYLETGDIKTWQVFVDRTIQNLSYYNLNYNTISKSGQLLLMALKKFYQKNLPTLGSTLEGIPTLQYLQSVERRLAGLNLVATTAAIATGLAQLNLNATQG
jgi:hypothetical protein